MLRLFPAGFGLHGPAWLDRTDSLPSQGADFLGLIKTWFAPSHGSRYVILKDKEAVCYVPSACLS